VPVHRALLLGPALAHPRVDEDAPTARLQEQAVQAEDDAVLLVGRVHALPQHARHDAVHRPPVEGEGAVRNDVDARLSECEGHAQPASIAYSCQAADRRYLGYVAVVTFMFSGQFAFISGSSFVLISGLGVSPDVYGFCFGAVAVGIMAGSFTTSRLTGRVGGDRLIMLGTALGAGAGLAMAALAWSGVRSVPAVIAPMFFFALGLGLANPNAVAGAVGPYPRMAGLAAAILGVIQMTGSALYGIGVGHVSDGTAVSMATAIASAGVTAFVAFALLRRSG